MKKYIISIVIIGISLSSGIVFAEGDVPMGAPNTIEEAQWFGQKIINGIPRVFKTAWQEGVYIFTKLWNWMSGILGKEVEKKKPEVEEEFNKEIKEMKEDVPKTAKSLWERLKDLVR